MPTPMPTYVSTAIDEWRFINNGFSIMGLNWWQQRIIIWSSSILITVLDRLDFWPVKKSGEMEILTPACWTSALRSNGCRSILHLSVF